MAPIPIIFDTDIGNDVDDTWAIAMALNCPELELRYVLTAGPGCHDDRAKLVAKLLDAAGVTGVPIGKGCDNEAAKAGNQAFEGEPDLAQSPWVTDYDLAAYSGAVHEDGVGELIRMVMASPEPLTLIAIGPLGNIGEALLREPRIAQKLHFVGMHGAVYTGYGGRPVDPVKGCECLHAFTISLSLPCTTFARLCGVGCVPLRSNAICAGEYNVWADIPSSQATFSAPFLSMTITPLDTCGTVQLRYAPRDTHIRIATQYMYRDRARKF
jgi:inosine-uridine nucleoside N-ribohydrolase